MSVSPELHAVFLGGATIIGLICAGCILARNPKSTPARMHAVYGGVVSWWFYCMAMLANADTTAQAQLWARLVHVSIGMLPGVIYHLNVATAGLAHEHRRGIRVHYGLSVATMLFCLGWPGLLSTPGSYSWGHYPRYTLWGLLPVGLLLAAFAQILRIFSDALRRHGRGTTYHDRVRHFYRGNWLSMVALVDFLPAFGITVYPFGFVVITGLYAAVMFGSIRYRIIEITPEIAAERILDTMPDGLLVIDTQGLVRLANEAAAHLFSCRVGDLIDSPLESIITEPKLLEVFGAGQSNPPSVQEVRFAAEGGTDRFVRLSGAFLEDVSGRPIARVWLLHDLTAQRVAEAEKERLEGWIRQTQKLETLGVMAGGIAHDFNNILQVIMGNADLLRIQLGSGSSAHEEVRTITTAAERAAQLTRQMLTYAGQGAATRRLVDLNTLSREMAELMFAAISKKAKLTLELADRLPMVVGDESQIRQVVLNLITNASEALGHSPGTILLRTGVLESDSALTPAPRRGEPPVELHVLLEVTDTGIGMDHSTKDRIFDPFFTTKFTGRGLGLATVLGIVQGHGGLIAVDSEPGHGTSFTVVLPAVADVQASMAIVEAGYPDWRGRGLALLADDETAVRRVVREMLIGTGFAVVEAANGAEAVAIFRDRKAEVSLVVLDLAMPEMSGKEAFSEIRSVSPDVPVVFMSGYAEIDCGGPIVDPRASFLRKPFKPAALASKIREANAGAEEWA